MNKTMKQQIRILSKQLNDFCKSKPKDFSTESRRHLNFFGVYAIYQNKKIIYIGSSIKGDGIKRRLRALLADPRRHTLHRKLKKRYKTSENVRNFLKKKCTLKVIELNKQEAKMFEHFAIGVLKPKYNS